MTVELISPAFSPSAIRAASRPAAAVAAPEDLAGTRFVGSVGWALLAAAWGAWLGSMVESAVEFSGEARVGALIVAPLLVLCGAILAFIGSARNGTKEALGRALMDAITFAWQGAWLGALIGGGFAAAGGGAWVIAAALGAVCLGGLIGLGVGRRLFGKNLHKILNCMIWGGVIAGFAASFFWQTTAWAQSAAPVADSAKDSVAFGPAADWIWRTAGAAPLVLTAFVWWLRWMREERSKKEKTVGWGMAITAFLFVAAMAAGAGAIVGGLAQLGCGYLVYHVNLTPTPGAWMGAIVALFFWGLGQQPKRPAAFDHGH
jgi:hypothetical protein